MRNLHANHRGLAALLGGNHRNGEQLSLPFDIDEVDPAPRPITTRHLLDLADRCGRRYEVTVHQDPRSLAVLSYSLRIVSVH